MPSRPTWFARLPDAIAQLEEFPRETVTRTELQTVLALSKRRTVQLMHEWAAERRGGRGDLELARGPLLRRWKALCRGRRYVGEQARVARMGATLRAARVSRVKVTVPRDALGTRLLGLPPGVVVEPRRIVVDFDDAKEAIAKLFALAQALGNDWDAFEEVVNRGQRPICE
jgi:hypothetical protein